MVHELALSWRSRLRIAVVVVVTFAVGVVALTPDAPWPVRLVCAIAFLIGAYGVLDAVVFTSSWRFTDAALKVPTLASRRREVSGGDELAVELLDGPLSMLSVTGPNGTRVERINPLVSGHDLRRWFDGAPPVADG